ncbi:MAG TPA: hypothetical protein VD932_05955 [Aquabacterium sp.]|nr:hypothetical protein [Aquabacterium sp.]
MVYQPLVPPTLKMYKAADVPTLKNWFGSFLDRDEERVVHLENFVRSSPSYEDWIFVANGDSIRMLGDWLAEKIRSIEIGKQSRRDPLTGVEIVPDLSDMSRSLAYDASRLFGRALIALGADVRWGIELDDPKSVNYGQPLLYGFGRAPCNPGMILQNFCTSAMLGRANGVRLRQLFDTWKSMIGGLT